MGRTATPSARQVPAVPPCQGLDGDLVADPLDEHDDAGAVRPLQRQAVASVAAAGPVT